MKRAWSLNAAGKRTDRQRRRVGAEDRLIADDVLHPRNHLFLHLAVFEHRLDDEIAILQCDKIRRRRDAREHRVAVGRGGAAAIDLIGHQLLRMRLALFRGFRVLVDEDDFETGKRADISDAGAHETGAEHADLLDRPRRDIGRPPRALVELAHRHEQRADHRGGLRRTQNVREPARFDAQRLIDRQLQALVDDLEDRARGRIIVVGFAPVDRVRRREHHHAGFRIDRAAGQPKAVRIPRRLGAGAGFDPVLRRLYEIACRHDGVDELHRLGAIELELVTFEQKLQRVRRRQHARNCVACRRLPGTGRL